VETREERIERRRRERAEQVTYKLEREIAMWDPAQVEEATEDPFKTLFISRIVSIHCLMFTRHIANGLILLRHFRITTLPSQN
jgi:hypothetical protein